MAKWGLQTERFFHEVRDEFRLFAETLLKILVVRHEAHGIADQARRGLTSSGQQDLQGDDARGGTERPGLHAASDGGKDVLTRLIGRNRQLIGDPGPKDEE